MLLGKRRDRKTINTIVLEREGEGEEEEGRERESRILSYQDVIYISFLHSTNLPSTIQLPQSA